MAEFDDRPPILSDCLSVIASRYGCSVEDLMAANGIDDSDKIEAGQKLRVPKEDTKVRGLRALPPPQHAHAHVPHPPFPAP